MTYTGWIPDVLPDGTIESAWGNAIRDRTLTPFANAAARTTAIPVPKAGMIVYMTDSKLILIYNGTKWTAFGKQAMGYKAISGACGPTTPYDISAGGFAARLPANCAGIVSFALTGYKVAANPAITVRCFADSAAGLLAPAYSARLVTDLVACAGICVQPALAVDTLITWRMDGQNNTAQDLPVSGWYQVDAVPA